MTESAHREWHRSWKERYNAEGEGWNQSQAHAQSASYRTRISVVIDFEKSFPGGRLPHLDAPDLKGSGDDAGAGAVPDSATTPMVLRLQHLYRLSSRADALESVRVALRELARQPGEVTSATFKFDTYYQNRWRTIERALERLAQAGIVTIRKVNGVGERGAMNSFRLDVQLSGEVERWLAAPPQVQGPHIERP
jgi:DNA-binding transcriptional ArsR family regulator